MFDIMNNLPFLLNNRMDGIEIAESLLYKDFERPNGHKNFHTALSDACAYLSSQVDVNKLNFEATYGQVPKKTKEDIEVNKVDVVSSCLNVFDNLQSLKKLKILQNNSCSAKFSESNEEYISENKESNDMENSTAYFRPISTNISVDFKKEWAIDPTQKTDKVKLEVFKNKDSTITRINEKDVHNRSDELYYNFPNNETKDLKTIEHEGFLQNSKYDEMLFLNGQCPKIKENEEVGSSKTVLVSLDTINIMNSTNHKELSFQSQCTRMSFNNPQIDSSEAPNSNQTPPSESYNHNEEVVTSKEIMPIADSAPISSVPSKALATTIKIPRGSYIFIPLSLQNFPIKELQNNHASIPDLLPMGGAVNGNNKYILGCYPMINKIQDVKVQTKQLPPIILPKSPCPQNMSPVVLDLERSNICKSQFHASQLPANTPVMIKGMKRKPESTEFNYYLNIIGDSHRMLMKEKSKISMDRNVVKDENLKTAINFTARNNNNMNKLDKELNLLINSLFEINVLISKIESMRGITFIEPFYNILQNAAELIQGFHFNENTVQCSQRCQNLNKQNEKEIEIQIEKLKRLFCDLQKIRTFLWASYTNFILDQERLLSASLNKLKGWSENKKKVSQSIKLRESTMKSQMTSCVVTNEESSITYQNVPLNSVRPTIKFDRSQVTIPTQSYSIPVSQYHTVPSRMTTILQRFPNQHPTNPQQYNYIQTSLSSFTHPALISNNKFSIGSNCHLSYGSQQQLYAATPINANHTPLPTRNFLIGPSSLMTPIIYQNNSHPVINNSQVNLMLYKMNTSML